MKLTVLRDGKKLKKKVRLIKRPKRKAGAGGMPELIRKMMPHGDKPEGKKE